MNIAEDRTSKRRAQTAAARREFMTRAARRAADDPVALAKAARIVRAGIERGHLTEDDLRGPIVQPQASP